MELRVDLKFGVPTKMTNICFSSTYH